MKTENLDPAKILIADYIELITMIVDTPTWEEQTFADNPPRFFRIKRIKACLNALGLQCESFHDLDNGLPVEDVSFDIFLKVQEVLATAFSIDLNQLINERNKNSYSASSQFQLLLATRANIHRFKSLRNGVLVASGYYLTPIFVLKNIEQKLSEPSLAIDTALSLLLNPEQKFLSYKELVTEYNFPDIDLNDIDIEWL